MENNNFFFVDTERNGACYKHNAVKSAGSYTPAEYAALLRGESIPSEWDADGEPIAWDTMSID